MRYKNLIFFLFSSLAISGCSCGSSNYSAEIQPIQKSDKQLSCKDIIMEINEAEFYKKAAEERKMGRIEDVLFPYCYPSGYLSANKSQKSAGERLQYLNQVYELNDCEAKARFESKRLPPPPTVYQDAPPPPPVR